jgi:hypothetical protein
LSASDQFAFIVKFRATTQAIGSTDSGATFSSVTPAEILPFAMDGTNQFSRTSKAFESQGRAIAPGRFLRLRQSCPKKGTEVQVAAARLLGHRAGSQRRNDFRLR